MSSRAAVSKKSPDTTTGEHFFIYASIIISALAISLDFASVDLALPGLEQQFGLGLESVQWVINGYVLAFSVLMVAGGKLADAYGRKRVFLIGMSLFAFASLLGGASWDSGSVIGFRVLQGVGASLLWPAMIGMACGALGEEKRALALGLIFGTCSVGNAAGPVMGGALTQYLSWRWVLWVNVPMALFALLVTLRMVPWDKTNDVRPKNDYIGMGLLTFGLVALMLTVYQSDDWGWSDPRTIALVLATVGFLGAFPFHERRTAEPLVPPEMMKNREIQVLCLNTVVICQLFFIVLLYFTQYAMKFPGDDPVHAGLKVVQFMLSYGVVSYFGDPLGKFFGTRNLLVLGLVSATIASCLLGYFGPGANWLPFNGSLVLLGIGVGAVLPTVNVRAIEAVGTAKASLVSGITFMCQLSGSAVMLAINTVIFASVSAKTLKNLFVEKHVTLTAAENAAVESILRGAGSVHEIPAALARDTGDVANFVVRAYDDGLRVVLYLSAALVFIALLLTMRYVPHKQKQLV